MSTPASSTPLTGTSALAMTTLGNLIQTDNISTYLKRPQLYFEANRVEDDHKVAVLLTITGAKVYDMLRSLLVLDKRHSTNF